MTDTNLELKHIKGIQAKLDDIRARDERIDKALSIQEEAERAIEGICEYLGEEVDEAQIDEAVRSYFQDAYSFQEPRGVITNLAHAYIDRSRIAKKYGIPLAIITGLGFAGDLAVSGYHASQELVVEDNIESTFNSRAEIEEEIGALTRSSSYTYLTDEEVAEFDSIIEVTASSLEGTNMFFTEYFPSKSAKGTVTRENYKDVRTELTAVESRLEKARDKVSEARDILESREELISLEKRLHTLVEGSRAGLEACPTFLASADSAYQSGIGAVRSRDSSSAQKAIAKIKEERNNCEVYKSLSVEIPRLHQGILAIALDDRAKQQSIELFEDFSTYVSSYDVTSLKTTHQEMQYLNSTLNFEYSIRIVNRQGVNTGNWRYPLDSGKSKSYYDRNPEARNHYLIVEAVSKSGQTLSVRITNEENGRTKNVAMWGERIPYNIYQSVGRDKQDNGLIDGSGFGGKRKGADIMGKKEKGYLEPVFDGRFHVEGGQITEWKTIY